MVSLLRLFLAVVLVVMGLTVYPMIRASDNFTETATQVAESSSREFVDTVRSKGYVDPLDYQIFVDKLASTGVVFNIDLEHYKKRYEPLYGDPNNFYTFSNQFEVIYDGYFTKDILDRLFPSGNLPSNSKDRRYNMRTGDLFNVRISSSGNLPGTNINLLFVSRGPKIIAYNYGGMVRDEAP